jgi:hypothetical protein
MNVKNVEQFMLRGRYQSDGEGKGRGKEVLMYFLYMCEYGTQKSVKVILRKAEGVEGRTMERMKQTRIHDMERSK